VFLKENLCLTEVLLITLLKDKKYSPSLGILQSSQLRGGPRGVGVY
jgi:hypothetical protein